jgi:hypothetical protein
MENHHQKVLEDDDTFLAKLPIGQHGNAFLGLPVLYPRRVRKGGLA